MRATTEIKVAETGARYLNLFKIFPNAFGDKYHETGTYRACVACGRKTSTKGNGAGIVVGGGGFDIIHPEDADLELNDSGFMGWFPVGSECLKALPAEWSAPNPETV
jgi:hypothetical protein